MPDTPPKQIERNALTYKDDDGQTHIIDEIKYSDGTIKRIYPDGKIILTHANGIKLYGNVKNPGKYLPHEPDTPPDSISVYSQPLAEKSVYNLRDAEDAANLKEVKDRFRHARLSSPVDLYKVKRALEPIAAKQQFDDLPADEYFPRSETVSPPEKIWRPKAHLPLPKNLPIPETPPQSAMEPVDFDNPSGTPAESRVESRTGTLRRLSRVFRK